MIPVEEALEIILKEINPLGTERVGLLDALGRTLAQDVSARVSNPPWDNSAMDGYALRASDTAGAAPDKPVILKVIYDLPAGTAPSGPVNAGEAVRIMTGAPMPEGADAVLMVERTESAVGAKTVRILAESRVGDNIRRGSEDFKEGDVLLTKGTLVRPAEVAMCATIGVPEVQVYKRPTVAVLSTGDELVDIDSVPLAPAKITNSNGYALSALVAECGGVPVNLGIADDTKESLKEKLAEAREYDCIVSSGGVSVGDYDFVKDVLEELGSEMVFWKVAMKPGKPLAFGIIGGKPAFGLPGNPISSMVAFEQFVRPAIAKMSGVSEYRRRSFSARLTSDLRVKPGRTNFVRALLTSSGGVFSVTPLVGQGSGMISTMVRANSFIVVPAESEGFKKDETVEVRPFDPSILFE